MAPQLPVEQTKRYGRYGLPLGWVYAVLHLLLIANIFVFIALAACLFFQARFLVDGWGSPLGFWIYIGPMLTLGIPWMVCFWMYHVFFRLYTIIYFIVLVTCVLWHSVIAIILTIFDISDKTDFYRGDSNTSSGDIIFWIYFVLNLVLVVWYFIYILFGIYIFRRTADRKMIDARARAEEVRPDTSYGQIPRYSYGAGGGPSIGAGRDEHEAQPSGNAFTVGFLHALPIVAPMGASIPEDERDDFEDFAAEKEDQGWDLSTVPFGFAIHMPSLFEGRAQPSFSSDVPAPLVLRDGNDSDLDA